MKKRRYSNLADAFLGVVLLLAVIALILWVALLIVLPNANPHFVCFNIASLFTLKVLLGVPFVLIPYIAFGIMARNVRRQLLLVDIPNSSYTGLFACIIVATGFVICNSMMNSISYDPVDDLILSLALPVPFILTPITLVTIMHWLRSRNKDKIVSEIKGRYAAWPIVAFVSIFCAFLWLIISATPNWKDTFRDFGGQLPGPTESMVDLSNFLLAPFGGLIAVTIFFIGCYVFIFRIRSNYVRFHVLYFLNAILIAMIYLGIQVLHLPLYCLCWVMFPFFYIQTVSFFINAALFIILVSPIISYVSKNPFWLSLARICITSFFVLEIYLIYALYIYRNGELGHLTSTSGNIPFLNFFLGIQPGHFAALNPF